MKVCPVCNTENRDNAKFCDECGSKLELAAIIGADDVPRVLESDSTIAMPAFLQGREEAASAEPAPVVTAEKAAVEVPEDVTTAKINPVDTVEHDAGFAVVEEPSGTAGIGNETSFAAGAATMEVPPIMDATPVDAQQDAVADPDMVTMKLPAIGPNDLSGLGVFADGSRAESTAQIPSVAAKDEAQAAEHAGADQVDSTAKMPRVAAAQAAAASGAAGAANNKEAVSPDADAKVISAPGNRKEARARAKDLKRREREARRAMKEKCEPKTNKGKVVAIVACVVVVAALTVGVAYGLELIGGKTIPDTSGMSEADAVYTLQQAGFNTRVSMVKSDDTEGLVLLTDPASGSRVPKGSEVVVHVAQSRTIPQVKGLSSDLALQALRESGYVNISDLEYTKTNSVAEGTVLSVSPAEGEKVKSTAPVTLTVAENYKVPDVRGMTEANATYTLREAGYYVYVNTVENEQLDEGTVYTTDPAANAVVDADSYVTIYVVQHRSTQLEQLATTYLTSQGTVTISGVAYRVDSVVSTKYQSNGVVSFTIMGSPTTSFLGESITLSSRSVSGSITFNDNNEVIGVG